MRRPFVSKKALTRVQVAVITAIIIVAVVAVSYYLSFPALSPSPSPTPTSTFTPKVATEEWRLLVDGFVQRPMNLSLEEIVALPSSTSNAELYCLPSPGSSGVLVDEGNWTGVRLGFILEKAEVSPKALKVAFYAEDGFTTDLTVTEAMRKDILLAYEKDGKPIRQKLRLVAPGKWGYKWIHSVVHIELVNYDFKGTYESRGFPDNAEINS